MYKNQLPSMPELTVPSVAAAMWQHRLLVLCIWLVSAVGSVLFVLSLPNIYKSQAVLVASTDSAALGLSGQLGSLAAVAGINLNKDKGGDKSELALQLLNSRAFVSDFIMRHQLAIDIMAAKSWDPETKKISYDPDIYDTERAVWTREVDPPFTPEPSIQTLYKEFEKTLFAEKDKLTGQVKISLEHKSPELAKQWLETLIADVNETIRKKDIAEATRSIEYLEKKAAQTDVAELKAHLYSLIQEQTKILLLTNVKPEYALKTIDPPYAPEEKSEPKRALLVIMFCFCGFLLSIFVVVSAQRWKFLSASFKAESRPAD